MVGKKAFHRRHSHHFVLCRYNAPALHRPGTVTSLAVIIQHKVVRGRNIHPHISLVDTVFVVPVQYFNRGLIRLQVFLVDHQQLEQLPERGQLFPAFHHPVRGGGCRYANPHSGIFVYLPVQRHAVHIFVYDHLCHYRLGRNAFFYHPVRKGCDNNSFAIWPRVFRADITFYIKFCRGKLQYFGYFFTNYFAARDIFVGSKVMSSLLRFSGNTILPAPLARFFGFFTAGFSIDACSLSSSCLAWLVPNSKRSICPSPAFGATNFSLFFAKNIFTEFIELKTQGCDFFFFLRDGQQRLLVEFFVVDCCVFHDIKIILKSSFNNI